MDFIADFSAYQPAGRQEAADKQTMADMIAACGQSVLHRDNKIAHMTSSGFIINRDFTKTLLIHHNIYHSWGWTGGHADGCGDLLQVACREALEETGVSAAIAAPQIAALDILPVFSHSKNGQFVNAHLHFNLCYFLLADESAPLRGKPDENSGAAWFALDDVDRVVTETHMRPIYQKLIKKVRNIYAK